MSLHSGNLCIVDRVPAFLQHSTINRMIMPVKPGDRFEITHLGDEAQNG